MRLGKTLLLLLVILGMLIPTGCWDLTDINDHFFILGLGIDPDEEEGLYRFTFHYANPRGESSDQSSDTMTYVNATIRSSSLPLAVRELIRNSDSEANFEHMQALVLGVDYLDVLSFDDIDMLFRMASVRRKCVVVTTDIKASDLLSMKFSGTSTAVIINRLSNHYASSSSNVLEGFSLTSLYSKKKDDLSFYLFSVSAVENSNYSALSPTDQADQKDLALTVTGLSVFNNCKYTGQLGYTELETIRLLSNRQSEGIINVVSEDGTNACYQIVTSKCSKSCKIVDNEPRFKIKLDVECLLVDSGNKTIYNGEKLIEESLENKINDLIFLGRYKYGGDILGLESAARQDCRKWFDANRDYWQTGFKDANIDLTVNCKIASSGIIE